MLRDITYAVLFWLFAIASTYLLTEVAEAGSWLLWVAQ
jgi:hypothetical protein